MAKKKVLQDIIIIDLVLVKADWGRTFIGSVKREVDYHGKPIYTGEVIINEGMVWSKSTDEEELRDNLDAICLLKLDYNLHASTGESVFIAGTPFYLN